MKNKLIACYQQFFFYAQQIYCKLRFWLLKKKYAKILKIKEDKLNNLKLKNEKHFIFITKNKNTWEYESISWGLKRIGTLSVIFNDDYNTQSLILKINSAIKPVKNNILVTFHGKKAGITKRLLDYANLKDIFTVLISLDDQLGFFGKLGWDLSFSKSASIVKHADLCLTSSSSSLVKYKSHCALAKLLKVGTNLEKFALKKKIDFKNDFVFVGQIYGVRKILINLLEKNNIMVHKFVGSTENGRISDSKMIDLYHQSKAILGFGFVGHTTKLKLVKGRDAEALATGSIYVTSFSSDLQKMFGHMPNLFMYHNSEELFHILKKIQRFNNKRFKNIRDIVKRRRKSLGWDEVFREIFE